MNASVKINFGQNMCELTCKYFSNDAYGHIKISKTCKIKLCK